jgi:cation diffusion facilitator CzcD-associated flavoprotein CzcO
MSVTDSIAQADDAAVATDVAAGWLAEFASAVSRSDVAATVQLFLADGYWRDLLALTWDLRTLHGHESMAAVLQERLDPSGFTGFGLSERKSPWIVESAEKRRIEAFFDFDTTVGRGVGLVRLVRDSDGAWKAWTVLTALQELKGHEMLKGNRRALGHSRESAVEGRENWLARRRRTSEFVDTDPEVLIVGAGQSGLALAAQLGLLSVETLVIEKNDRVGDNWRKRYESLVLHDPVWADHLPYLPFPEPWPVYTPKDKLADWLELYASAMELNVWTKTELRQGVYDESAARWTINLSRADGSLRTIRPVHVVLATGVLGEPNMPALEGAESFAGEILHSSSYAGAEGWAGRKVVVVGACTSGHDIAQELYENAVDVTLVQRSSTYVVSQEKGVPVLFGDLYWEGGPPTDEADLLAAGFPFRLILEFAREQTRAIAELDRELLEGLRRVGFETDMGENGGGLWSRALTRGGGFYIDVGCSWLIANGDIKFKHGELARLDRHAVVFDDGSAIDADVVVLATGYANMRETARNLFGNELAERVKPVWNLDPEGELNALWRDSGHPGFWYMGGSLAMVRIYSKFLALQIKALMEGLIDHPSATR